MGAQHYWLLLLLVDYSARITGTQVVEGLDKCVCVCVRRGIGMRCVSSSAPKITSGYLRTFRRIFLMCESESAWVCEWIRLFWVHTCVNLSSQECCK